MQITIYDQYQDVTNLSIGTCMVLGIHSFIQFLQSLPPKRNINILVQGNIQFIIQNILWHQFFSYTLLKDIVKSMHEVIENKNCFLKINGKTFKLGQSLEWQNVKKLSLQIKKCPDLSIECFFGDGSIKVIQIHIGQPASLNYDLIFKCEHVIKTSMNCNNKSKKQILSQLQKVQTVKLNTTNQCPFTKSLFEETKQRQNSTCRYETQRKTTKIKIRNNQNDSNRLSLLSKKSFNKSVVKSKGEDRQQTLKSVTKTYDNKIKTLGNNFYQNKQEVVANLLAQKQAKIKYCQQIIEQKDAQFEQKIAELQQSHQQQVNQIKDQVQQVLSNYKSKNKELRKQNLCLSEMNEKLTINNNRLEESLLAIRSEMKGLQEGQERLIKQNAVNCQKLQKLQKLNNMICNQKGLEQVKYEYELSEKNRAYQQVYGKYERLLGTIKLAASQNKDLP